VTINCHIPRRNVTIHISNKTRIWEHYAQKLIFRKTFQIDNWKNRNFPQKLQFSPKITIFRKNCNFAQQVKFFPRIEPLPSKWDSAQKSNLFFQKLKFSPKIQILPINPIFFQKLKFSPKIEILPKNRNFITTEPSVCPNGIVSWSPLFTFYSWCVKSDTITKIGLNLGFIYRNPKFYFLAKIFEANSSIFSKIIDNFVTKPTAVRRLNFLFVCPYDMGFLH